MTNTNRQFDCIVVGGGLIGLLSAYLLAKQGQRIALLEQGELGKESSWAGGGILSPLYPWRYPDPVSQLVKLSHASWNGLISQLEQESGLLAESINSGLLILDQEEQQAALAWAQRFDVAMEKITAAQTQQLEPALTTQSHQALWMPEVGQVRNPRLLQALQHAAEKAGVTILEHHPVTKLLTQQKQITGVACNQGEFLAPTVVIAMGAWSSVLLEPLGFELNIEPVKGQMIQFQAPPTLLQRITLHKGRYIIPRRDGHVLAGSTLEHVGFNKETDDQARQQLIDAAIELAPALAECPVVNQWSGLRPGSPDGIPTIGELNQVKGLYLNCGHFRNGVAMGAASCQLLCDLINDHPPALDPTPFLPND